MQQVIVDFKLDDVGDWVAELACGHAQHVRHCPPWINRLWVTSEKGRKEWLGRSLECSKCEENKA